MSIEGAWLVTQSFPGSTLPSPPGKMILGSSSLGLKVLMECAISSIKPLQESFNGFAEVCGSPGEAWTLP